MEDKAYFDYLDAREAALTAAIGSFVLSNVPRSTLDEIVESAKDKTIELAARIARYKLKDGLCPSE